MPRKKIVFVIVEGPSDEEALGVLLNRIYAREEVHVEIMHCDITTELNVNSSNVIAKIGDVVKKYAERKFRPGDFSRIIHITDTDGAFIPDEAVVEDAAAVKPLYSATEIRTQRKSGIENRNQRKRECLNRLSSASRIWGVPCNGVQREHNKKLNNGLPILHKVPPKRDYGRYFCIMAEKGGTSHGGLTEKLSPFFHAKKQEVNAYGR